MFESLENNQKIIIQTLKNSFKNKKSAHAYLIIGEKLDTSLNIAKYISSTLLCSDEEPCYSCPDCTNTLKLTHNNIYIIDEEKSIKKNVIKELQVEFSKKSFSEKPKIFIMKNAENMNDYAANSLLKFIEEPNPNEVGIILASSESKILPTIISRCQVLKLVPESSDLYIEELLSQYNREKLSIEILIAAGFDKKTLQEMLESESDTTFFQQLESFVTSLYNSNAYAYIEANKISKSVENPKLFISCLTEIFRRGIRKMPNFEYMNFFSRLPMTTYVEIIDLLLDMQKRLEYNVNFSLQLERLAIMLESKF